MKVDRLSVLLAVMAALAVLRFAFPPKDAAVATAEPVVRQGSTAALQAAAAAPRPASNPEPSVGDDDRPGNAFAVRLPPAPPPPPMPLPPPVAQQAAATPVVAQEPPPPPLQVIGTYDDGGAPAVFVATPTETLIARPGTLLLADYRVTNITAQQVALTQASTQRTLQLPIPSGVSR